MNLSRVCTLSITSLVGLITISGCSGSVVSDQSLPEACEIIGSGLEVVEDQYVELESNPDVESQVLAEIDAISADVSNAEVSPAWNEFVSHAKALIPAVSQMATYRLMEEESDLTEVEFEKLVEEVETLQEEAEVALEGQQAAFEQLSELCSSAN